MLNIIRVMKMKKTLILLLVVAMLVLTGCKKSEPEPTTVPTTVTTTAQPEKIYYNFLTGEKRSSEKIPRPVAVTVNNIEAALPQYGVSGADILMEFPAEGGITRLLALYSDYSSMPDVCSIRSCRYYFPIFARGFGAVYFCYGSNTTLATPKLEELSQSGLDYIDGNKAGDSVVFERDKERLQSYSLEHTAFLKGSNMKEIFKKYGFDKQLASEHGESAFDFSLKALKFSEECKEITASFSASYNSRFTYDETKKVYLKEHNGDKHIDGKTEKQLAYKNVLILETEVSNYQGTKLIEFDWTGGTGYYATNGTVQQITWQKKTEASPIELFDMLGNPMKINTGKSYIGVGTQQVIIPEPETTQAAQ